MNEQTGRVWSDELVRIVHPVQVHSSRAGLRYVEAPKLNEFPYFDALDSN